MGELGLNKIMGAGFATVLGIMGLQTLSSTVFGEGGHHGAEKPELLSEWAAKTFPGYYPEIQDVVASGADVVIEVFDLGLALSEADIARGEGSLNAKCASCHTWTEGGANAQGPALFGVVGRDIGSVDGFGYSRAFQDYGGSWTYEELNGYLENPKRHLRGTAMAFNGIKGDSERAAVIAYLASLQPNAPAFPDPLPEEPVEEAALALEDGVETAANIVEAGGDVVEAGVETVEATASEALDAATDEAVETGNSLIDQVVDAAEEATSEATEQGSDILGAIGDAVETAEETVDDLTDGDEE